MRRQATALVLVVWVAVAWGTSPGPATAGGEVTASNAEPEVGMLAFVGYNPDRRDRTEIFTIRTDGGERRQLTTTGGYSPAWSADGQAIAYTTLDHHIGLSSADGSAQRVVAEGSWPAWSPDGQHLTYRCATGAGLCLLDLQTQAETVLVPPTRAWPRVEESSWSPDGSWIVFTRYSRKGDDYTSYRQLFLVRPDGTDLTAVPNTFPEGTSPTWSADGTVLLYTERYDGRGGAGGDLWSIRPDGTERTPVRGAFGSDDDATPSPDGELIAAEISAGLYPDKHGIWTITPSGHLHDFVVRGGWDPSWRPGFTDTPAPPPPPPVASGEPIAYVAAIETGFDLFTVRPDGTDLTRLTSNGEAADPAWSPDHTQIAYRHRREYIRVIDVATGTSRRVARSLGVGGLAWSPNGRRLAWGSSFGLVVLNLATGERKRIPVRGGWDHQDPAWSPDGQRLAFSYRARDIMTVSPAGGTTRRVTRLGGQEVQLDWSADGRRILFSHRVGPWWKESADVKSVRRGGQAIRTLVAAAGLEVSPSWSPTGDRIAWYGEGPDPFGAAPKPGLWTAGPRGGHRQLVVPDRTIAYVDW